jgi:Tfp pilus assembly protein PilN
MTDVSERFAQDIRMILDPFGWDVSAVWPILVLSDGSETINRVVASLNASDLLARASLPCPANIKTPPDFDAGDVYQYRTALGLALLAMKEPAERLDLFAGIVQGQTETKGKRARYSVILAAAVAAIMLVALVVTSYAVDKARDSHYRKLLAQTDLEQARQRQSLMKTVAQHRPDLLQLLTDINSGQNPGVVLDSLHFKKGQAATLTGQTDNEEQLWKFQGNLRGRKGLDDVEISNVSQDAKTKKVKFTITFQYRSFTKKGAVL